jgi:peptidoglycan/xylan/chitin deacetylase (PgdA/CDA1 family)
MFLHKLIRRVLALALFGLLSVYSGAPLAQAAPFTAAVPVSAKAPGCAYPPVALGTAIYGATARGATAHEVALTYDDGPSAYTSSLLSELEHTGTPATFFVIGEHASAYPSLLRREWNDGFVVGVHTWDHPDLTRLSVARIHSELSMTVQAIHNALGHGYCARYFRPPYGSFNRTVLAQARYQGLATIMWDVDPVDWSRPGTQTIVSRVLRQVHAGSIILMHDGGGNRSETVAALPSILAGLRARGLRPVTLPKLLADAR